MSRNLKKRRQEDCAGMYVMESWNCKIQYLFENTLLEISYVAFIKRGREGAQIFELPFLLIFLLLIFEHDL